MHKAFLNIACTNLSRDLLGSLAGAETVLESALDVLQVLHAAGTSGAPAGSLKTPVEVADLRGGVTAASATLLLVVPSVIVATAAHRAVALSVRLLPHARSTLRHCSCVLVGEIDNEKSGFG